jgi:hypothetical protein
MKKMIIFSGILSMFIFIFCSSPDSGIVIWGDSMGETLTAELLSTGLKAVGDSSSERKIVNWALGGQSSWQVAVRQGAIPWTVEVAGGVIPDSGSVELVNHRTPLRTEISLKTGGKIPADLQSRSGWMSIIDNAKATWVRIAGIEGQVVAEGKDQSTRKFLFYRKEKGARLTVKNPVDVKILGTGKKGEHSLKEINSYIAILWPFGAHLNAFLPTREVYGQAKAELDPAFEADAEMAIVHAMIKNISSPEKHVIILYKMATFPAPSNNLNMQNDRVLGALIDNAYKKNFPFDYFNFVPAFANGLGDIQPSKEWLLANYPEEFNDPESGWFSEGRIIITKSGEARVTPQEPAAVAKLKLIENGGSGVQSSLSVATETKGATEFIKVQLKVGVEAVGGIAKSLTVREGGRGYAVGDSVIIPSGSIGNANPIVGEVIGLCQETLGTVHNPDGSVDTEVSYSQWDLDNGYVPRIFRRDGVHFTPRGSEYLCLLLASKIKANGW